LENNNEKILFGAVLLAISNITFAEHHEEWLMLKERQPAEVMQATSVIIGEESTIIAAEGRMGRYGKV
jgi:hypothetical protein